jgi:hypothetical protein
MVVEGTSPSTHIRSRFPLHPSLSAVDAASIEGEGELPDTEEGRQDNEERKSEQLDLLRLSRNSRQIIAEVSGHDIELDDPALVVDAIREVVDATMRHRKLIPSR